MLIVDRIEHTPHGDVAVCEREDGGFESAPLSVFAVVPREGDCVQWRDGLLVVDEARTRERRERAKALLEELLHRK